MTVSADPPPASTPPEQEFKVTFLHYIPDAVAAERQIAEVLAAAFGVRVTATWEPPF